MFNLTPGSLNPLGKIPSYPRNRILFRIGLNVLKGDNLLLLPEFEPQIVQHLLIIKANEMHNFSDLFDKVLYMFRTGPLFIIRSISTLYTRNKYLSC
jgi:hypothetical protein